MFIKSMVIFYGILLLKNVIQTIAVMNDLTMMTTMFFEGDVQKITRDASLIQHDNSIIQIIQIPSRFHHPGILNLQKNTKIRQLLRRSCKFASFQPIQIVPVVPCMIFESQSSYEENFLALPKAPAQTWLFIIPKKVFPSGGKKPFDQRRRSTKLAICCNRG